MSDDVNVTEEIRKAGERAKILRVIDDSTKVIKDEGYGIYFKGKRIALRSGKAVWRQKNHASAALSGKIKRAITDIIAERNGKDYPGRAESEEYKEIIKGLQEDGVLVIKSLCDE